MFGYINVFKDTLQKGQYGAWNTFLCGMCTSLKAEYGNKARLTAGWDINFYNVLFHSVKNLPAKIEMQNCLSSPLKKRSIMQKDEITDKLATANLLLAYFNAIDDDTDGDTCFKHKVVLSALKKPFKKAKQNAPELFDKLNECYQKLLKAEKQGCANIDQTCEYTADMSVYVAKFVLGDDFDNPYLSWLCYNVGKWVYIIDALDDLKKDYRTNKYNPLYAWLGKIEPKEFVKNNIDELEFLFYSTLNKIAESFNDMQLTAYTCLLKNIIYESMRKKTQEIFDKYLVEKNDKKQGQNQE